MGAPSKVTPGFASVPLTLVPVPAGQRWWRLYRKPPHTAPLGFGYRASRFSDPRVGLPDAQRYGVVYLGSAIEVCFLETILRDTRNGTLGDWPLAYADLQRWWCAHIVPTLPLACADLRKGGAVALGIPTDAIRGSRHVEGPTWSLAFWSHPQQPDGLLYPSRFNDQANLAVFDRALPKLHVETAIPLLKYRTQMAALIHKYNLAIV